MWFQNIFRHPNNQPSSTSNLQSPGGPPSLSLSPSLYSQLDRLRLRGSRHLCGAGAGLRASPRRRPAAEFLEHRPYTPGDDVRFVDWKASARSEHIYLKQGEQPQETTVHLLVDTSPSMAWGTPPKSHAALTLAAALGYLTLANEDKLHLVPLEAAPARFQAFKGKAQFPTLLNHLRPLSFTPPQSKPALAETLRAYSRATPRGGMLLLLSDLLDMPDLDAALSTFPRPTWEVTVFHLLHPHELHPALSGEFELVDAETGQSINYDLTPQALAAYRQHLQTWRNAVELTCIENKAFYTLLPTDWSLEKEVIPHLRKVRVLESM
ncbi:MAG: DUF58 domain-containing protein [Anaerolineales bacterium]